MDFGLNQVDDSNHRKINIQANFLAKAKLLLGVMWKNEKYISISKSFD